MKKVVYLSLAIAIVTTRVLFADCAVQDSDIVDQVSFEVTIVPDSAVHTVDLFFTFSAGIGSAAFTITAPGAGAEVTGGLSPGDSKHTDDTFFSTGYSVFLADPAEQFTIRADPPGSGTFDTGDALTWTLSVSNISADFEITGVSVSSRGTGGTIVPSGASVNVSPCNKAPTVAGIQAPQYSTTVPRRVTLTADNAADENGGDTLTYNWDSDDTTIAGTTSPVTYTYPGPPSADLDSVTLQVSDQHGATSTSVGPVSVNPNDRPVIADFTAENHATVERRVDFSLDAADYSDIDGDAIHSTNGYSWNFGEPASGAANTSTEAAPSHTYDTAGTYTVTLVVTDARGLPSHDTGDAFSKQVTPSTLNNAPTVTGITATCSDTDERTATLVAEGAADTEDSASALTYLWSSPTAALNTTLAGLSGVGASSVSVLFPDAPASPDPDEFTVNLTVQDTGGLTSSQVSTTVNPNDAPTVTAITPTVDVSTPRQVGFSSNAADPDGNIVYAWNFGDPASAANTSTDAQPTHTFSSDGSFTVTLTVSDTCGLSASAPVQTTVNPDEIPDANATPTAPSGLRVKVNMHCTPAPAIVTLTPSYSDDTSDHPDDNPATQQYEIQWDLDGNGSFETIDAPGLGTPAVQVVEFTDPGDYSVSMRAIEKPGFQSPQQSWNFRVYPNERASFPGAIGVPYDPQKFPLVDGILEGDDSSGSGTDPYGETGWRGSYRVPYGDGSDSHVTVDTIRQGDDLYVGIAAAYDTDLTAADTIVIGIGQDDEARISDADGVVGLLLLTPESETVVAYQTNAVADWVPTAVPAGIEFAVVENEAANRWSAEIKLPVGASAGAPWLDVEDQFLFFFDIYRAESVPPTMTRFTWPRTVPLVATIDDLDAPQLDPVWWGIAHRDNSFVSNGLSLPNYSYVGAVDPANVNGPFISSFYYTEPPTTNTYVNTLAARVVNSAHRNVIHDGQEMVKMLPAPDVRVRFKIANWGVPPANPDYWITIDTDPDDSGEPEQENPTPYKEVPVHPAVLTADPDGIVDTVMPNEDEVFTVEWTLSEAQIGDYTTDTTDSDGFNERHQCILVELETIADTTVEPEKAVNVVTRSVHRNMNFYAENDDAFTHPAEVSAVGYDLPLVADEDHTFLLRIFTREWSADPETLPPPKHPPQPATNGNGIAAEGAASPREARVLNDVPRFTYPPYYLETQHLIHAEQETVYFIEYLVKAYLYTGNTVAAGGEVFEEVIPVGSYGHVVRHVGETEAWDFSIVGAEKINDTTYLLRIPPGEVAQITDRVEAIEPPRVTLAIGGGAAIPDSRFSGSYRIGPAVRADVGYRINAANEVHAVASYSRLDATSTPADYFGAALLYRRVFAIGSVVRPFAGAGVAAFMDPWQIDVGVVLGVGVDFAFWRRVHLQVGADYNFSSSDAWLQPFAGFVVRFPR